MIRAKTPAAVVRAARLAAGRTLGQAADIAGLSVRSSWAHRETSCSPRVASRLLTALHGAPWVCVEGPGWAVAGPEADIRSALGVISSGTPESAPSSP